MMSIRVAINGFGRIGRLVFKAAQNDSEIEFVAINDLTDAKTLAHLLKYDSVHGKYPAAVGVEGNLLVAGKRKVKVLAEKDPAKLPWADYKVDVVVESTGVFRKRAQLENHLNQGAKRVLLTVPAKDDIDNTIVLGVNDHSLKSSDRIVSNASCTTNCLAPIAKILHEQFGIVRGFMTTIHGYTNDQRVLDLPHSDLRRARAAAVSMIPTTTGAARAVGKVIPELKGKMDGVSIRVPVVDGSLVDLVAELKKTVTAEDINAAVKKAAQGPMKNIVEYCEDPIVSVDVIGNSHSSIFDSLSTAVMDGNFVKVFSWYDNEWGYSCRTLDLVKKLAGL
jgi:glyceraldehyde 3-phosphate dehydrogenase